MGVRALLTHATCCWQVESCMLALSTPTSANLATPFHFREDLLKVATGERLVRIDADRVAIGSRCLPISFRCTEDVPKAVVRIGIVGEGADGFAIGGFCF